MELTTVWFILIAVLFVGYFVLEGFDFGVGMLVGLLGKDDRERRVLVNTIGPLWDGNEVWLVVAGGAMFAAFPEWYATLFSGFYLPLLLILVALIVRGVAFEYRGKRPESQWKERWDWMIILGSFLPALLWGVAFANIVRGVPVDAEGEYVGGFFNLLNPYALVGGLLTLSVFLVHGALFVALKTLGDIRERAHRLAQRVGIAAAAIAVVFIAWTGVAHDSVAVWTLGVLGALAFVGALSASFARRDGWAFAGTAAAIGLVVTMLFTALFPDVLPSTLDASYGLTVENASSTPYTLKIMTWVAVAFVPIVVGYQAWSYWVFRRRIGAENIPVDAGQ